MAAATPIFEGFTNACHTNILDSFRRSTIACHTNISDLLTALQLHSVLRIESIRKLMNSKIEIEKFKNKIIRKNVLHEIYDINV